MLGAVLFLNVLAQKCEGQKSCRDEAIELVEQFDYFASIESRIPELKKRPETRKAVKKMLHLIGSTADYISSNTSGSVIGMLYK